MSLKQAEQIIAEGGFFYDKFNIKITAHINWLIKILDKNPQKRGCREARLRRLQELQRESYRRIRDASQKETLIAVK